MAFSIIFVSSLIMLSYVSVSSLPSFYNYKFLISFSKFSISLSLLLISTFIKEFSSRIYSNYVKINIKRIVKCLLDCFPEYSTQSKHLFSPHRLPYSRLTCLRSSLYQPMSLVFSYLLFVFKALSGSPRNSVSIVLRPFLISLFCSSG